MIRLIAILLITLASLTALANLNVWNGNSVSVATEFNGVANMASKIGVAIGTNSQYVLPDERKVQWEGFVGVFAAPPATTNIFTNFTAGADTTNINAAIVSASAAGSTSLLQVVLLADGDYTNVTGIRGRKYVELRGSSSNTVFHMNGNGFGGGDSEASMGFYIGTSMFAERTGGSPGGSEYDVDSGYTKGSTNIFLGDSAAARSVGDLMCIDQTNNPTFVVNTGQYNTNGYTFLSRDNGSRAMGQIVEILSITDGTNITFRPPLYLDYTNTLDPEVVIWTPQEEWAGFKDFTVKCYSNGVGMVFGLCSSKYVWLDGVKVDFADFDHGRAGASFGVSVRNSEFGNSYIHGSGSFDNPIMMQEKTSAFLIENNIFFRTHCPIMIRSGASGGVIGYNYLFNPYDTISTNIQMYEIDLNHSAHSAFILAEGNASGQIRSDRAFGSSSHGTIFRNWVTGNAYIELPYNERGALGAGHWASQALRGISIDSMQYYFNVIGNLMVELNTPSGGVASLAVIPGGSVPYNDTITWMVFGQSDVGTSEFPDGTCYTNAIVEGNRDSASSTQQWSGQTYTLPASLYYSSTPTWWPSSLEFPPFDPSDTNTAQVVRLPAGYRWTYGTNAP